MLIRTLIEEDFVNYKKPSMFIGFPKCSWKCEIECGAKVCQNSNLAQAPLVDITVDNLIDKYLSNEITSAIVCGGLEPLDSWNDIKNFVYHFRLKSNDDIVIYTGYYEDEILDKIEVLKHYNNIIIKFGRFIPNQEKHFDSVLGVELASNNQYAKRIEDIENHSEPK